MYYRVRNSCKTMLVRWLIKEIEAPFYLFEQLKNNEEENCCTRDHNLQELKYWRAELIDDKVVFSCELGSKDQYVFIDHNKAFEFLSGRFLKGKTKFILIPEKLPEPKSPIRNTTAMMLKRMKTK